MKKTTKTTKTTKTAAAPFSVGDAILHRSVTMIEIGRITRLGMSPVPWIELEDGGWVADTGRFSAALATGSLSEFERAPGRFIVWLGAGCDTWPWPHALPQTTK